MSSRLLFRAGRGTWQWFLLIPVAAGVVAAVLPTSARAQEATCIPGFTLVTGGVPEADLDGDGLTCEVNSVDVTSVIWTTIAHDNSVDPLQEEALGCPDQFLGGFKKGLCCKSVPPGVKVGRLICIPRPALR